MNYYGSLVVGSGDGSGGSGAAVEIPIKTIKVNGEVQVPVNKAVDIVVPTKVSDLDDDSHIDVTEAEYTALSDDEKMSGKTYFCTDTGKMYRNGNEYGGSDGGSGVAINDTQVSPQTVFSSLKVMQELAKKPSKGAYASIQGVGSFKITMPEWSNATFFLGLDEGMVNGFAIYAVNYYYDSSVMPNGKNVIEVQQVAGNMTHKFTVNDRELYVGAGKNMNSMPNINIVGVSGSHQSVQLEGNYSGMIGDTLVLTKPGDIAKTEFEFSNTVNWGNVESNLKPYYAVKNGWCFVYILAHCNVVANDDNSIVFTGLPAPVFQTYQKFAGSSADASPVDVTITVDGKLLLREGTVGQDYSFTYSYPVA